MTDLRELRRLEPVFYRAPSAHNTQPWLLEYERDRLSLAFEPARYLEASDPTRRDLFLSLGAFVEAVLIVAAAEQVPLAFHADVDIAGSRVGVFTLAAACYKTPFAPADLERRRTSRLRYRPARLTAEVLGAARGQLSAGEVLHELAASELLELFTAADLHMLRSWPVVRELRAWLRLSKRHPSYELDGLTYECLALSRVEAAALSLLLHPMVYPLVRALRVHRLLTASARAVLDGDGSVLVLEAPAVTPEDVVAHGRTLLRVWLALSSHGLYTHPLSQIIDCAATEQALSEHLSVAEGRRLLSVVRAGVSEVPARSHRLRG